MPAVVVSYTISYFPSKRETSVEVPPTSSLAISATLDLRTIHARVNECYAPDDRRALHIVPARQRITNHTARGS